MPFSRVLLANFIVLILCISFTTAAGNPASYGTPYSHDLPKVFLLGPNKPATGAMSSALQTLGYLTSSSPGFPSFASIDSDDSVDLTWASEYAKIAAQNRNAKFILPCLEEDIQRDDSRMVLFRRTSSTLGLFGSILPRSVNEAAQQKIFHSVQDDVYRNYTRSVRDFFQHPARRGQLLEIAVNAPEPEMAMGEKWVRLCEFLGLGYSIVERLRLKDFPLHVGSQ